MAGVILTRLPPRMATTMIYGLTPTNNQRMIHANDGGACVSYNAAATWSNIYNQPTAQFYHVATDNRYPYRVYGTQQDNTSISVPSKSRRGAITWADATLPGTGESGYIAPHPENPNIVLYWSDWQFSRWW